MPCGNITNKIYSSISNNYEDKENNSSINLATGFSCGSVKNSEISPGNALPTNYNDWYKIGTKQNGVASFNDSYCML